MGPGTWITMIPKEKSESAILQSDHRMPLAEAEQQSK